jgi:hypothetical protein
MKLVTEFDQCLEKYPPISPGMLDPYMPPDTTSYGHGPRIAPGPPNLLGMLEVAPSRR